MRLAAILAVIAPALAPAAAQTRTTYVDLGSNANGILHEPATPSPKSRIAIISTNIGGNQFRQPQGPQLAGRGYRVLILNHYTDWVGFEGIAPALAASVRYLRGVPGVEKVLLLGHSGGGPLMTFYQNVAENGPGVCQGPEKLYPCRGNLAGLPKPDGLILLDSHLGSAFAHLTYVDPAVPSPLRPGPRITALDMFDPQNGYDPKGKGDKYSADFERRFFAAEGKRNNLIIDLALQRLALIEKGQGDYNDDEPFVVPGSASRLLQADTKLVSRTHDPHPLLKADGTMPTQIVASVRPILGQGRSDTGSFSPGALNTTVRRFLAGDALRATPDYGMTEDAITGIDWASSSTSAPSNIKGVKVPTLIMAMSCHYFLVPDEIIYNNSASQDKQYVLVEGASHGFSPCRPEYGDTAKRLFDYIDGWLSKDRFVPLLRP